jgi:hypothetical protein
MNMKNTFYTLLLMAVAILTSCSKTVSDDELGGGNALGNSNLSIITRADGTEGTVAYPVVLYVFNSSSECVVVKTLADAEAELTIGNLKADTYTVYAIGGADDTRYALPAQADATPTTLITLLDGKVHEDLMVAKNTVPIGEDEDNQLTLALQRVVCMVKEVEVKKIPADVEAVSLVITPLRESLQLNGDYNGEAGTFTLALTKQSDGQTWKNATPQYMMPSVGNATVSVKLTRDGNTRSYSYTCAEPLLANYKLNIIATYTGGTFDMTGTLTGATWAGERTITFEFDEENVTGSEETTQDGGNEQGGGEQGGGEQGGGEPSGGNTGNITPGAAPAVGTNYNGTYVLRSVDNGDGIITVTLMSPDQTTGLEFNEDNQESIQEAVDDAMADIWIDDYDWRLPTKEEMDLLYTNDYYLTVNANLRTWNFTTLAVSNATCFYFCTNANGEIISYKLNNGSTTVKPDDKTFLRAFTTLTFNQ